MALKNIAVILQVRNEAPFLDEWFQYYIALGFENFLVYNDSNPELPDDGTKGILDFWREKVPGLITNDVSSFAPEDLSPAEKERSCWEDATTKPFRYILNVDVDEYLVLAKGFDLEEYLEKQWNDNVGCIRINRMNAIDPVDFYAERKKGFEILQPTHLAFAPADGPGSYYHPNHCCHRPGGADGYKSFGSPERSTYVNAHEVDLPNPDFAYCDPGLDKMFLVHLQARGQLSKCSYTSAKYGGARSGMNNYRAAAINRDNCDRLFGIQHYSNAPPTKDILYVAHLFARQLFKKFFEHYGFLIIRNSDPNSPLQELGLLGTCRIVPDALGSVVVGTDANCEPVLSNGDILVEAKH